MRSNANENKVHRRISDRKRFTYAYLPNFGALSSSERSSEPSETLWGGVGGGGAELVGIFKISSVV